MTYLLTTNAKPPANSLVVCAGSVTCATVRSMGAGFTVFKDTFGHQGSWVDRLQQHLDDHHKQIKEMPVYLASIATQDKDNLIGGIATVPKYTEIPDRIPQYKAAVRGAIREAQSLGRPLFIQPIGIGVYHWEPEKAAKLFAEVIKDEDPLGALSITIPIFDNRSKSSDMRFKAAFMQEMEANGFNDLVDDTLRAPPKSSFDLGTVKPMLEFAIRHPILTAGGTGLTTALLVIAMGGTGCLALGIPAATGLSALAFFNGKKAKDKRDGEIEGVIPVSLI